MSSHYNPIAHKRQSSVKDIYKVLKPYFSKRKWTLLFIAFVSFIASLMGLSTPLLIREVMRVAIPSENINMVWLLGGAIFGAALVAGLMQFLSRYFGAFMAEKIILELRNDLYRTLQELKLEFYDEESTGQIMTRVTTDLNHIQRFVNFTLRLIMNGLVLFTGSYIAMIIINWQLGSILLIIFPGFIWLIYWFSSKVRPLFYESRIKYGSVTAIIQENITGAHIVRGFAQEENEIQRFTEANKEYRDLRIKTLSYRAVYFATMNLLIGIGVGLTLLLGGLAVTNDVMVRGDVVAYIFLLGLLATPTRHLTWLVGLIQRTLASGDRIIELTSAKKEIKESPDAISPPRFQGKITYENVFFEYEENRPILKNITVNIPPGQKVVVMGGTGSGKSTFILMLPRFYDPNQGIIKIDEHDIKKYKLKEMRKQIGLVLQETYLFNGTIKENIAFGKPDASDEEIVQAAEVAKIHEYIDSLPDKYETHVGDRGITLSGGQKQRVSIARTLVTNPSILIFDDSTASVDAHTEARIQESLDILSEGRTTLIISQRISSVQYADRILVFEKGEIVQDGSHEELIKQEGLYKNIYDTLSRSYEDTVTIPEKALQRGN